MSTDELRAPAPVPVDAIDRLRESDIELEGRMPWASNATFLVRVGDHQGIYKPLRGERPLWDFEPGLHRREVAAFRLSEAMGIGAVPPTVLRFDAPLGEGSIQWFVEADHREHYFTIAEGRPDLHDQLRAIAVLDVVANNTDRKSGHCLLAPGWAGTDRTERVWAIDNGLCFATSFKLRTVIWDFAGELLDPVAAEGVCRVAQLDAGIVDALTPLLSPLELEAMQQRAAELLTTGTMPEPDPGYHSVPWPLV
jgi:uncharacterized repeat protein (TIGR03843 family)